MANSEADPATETAKYKGQEFTWPQLVKKLGEGGAAKAAPELDPRYQSLVAKEGQAKGSEDYSHSVIDPATKGMAAGTRGLGSASQIQEGISEEKDRGGLIPGTLGALGSAIMSGGGIASGAGGIGQALFGGGTDSPATPGGKKPADQSAVTKYLESQDQKAKAAAQPSAAVGLMDSLVNQYQEAMGQVDPYINGTVAAQDSAKAASMGAEIGGPTQPAPAAAGQANAALAGDAQAYAKANDAGAAGIQGAMKDTGLADQQYLSVSPYLGLLNALTSEATYKQETAAAGGAGLAAPANSPSWYTQALSTLSGPAAASTGGATTVGAQPASSATTPSSNTADTAGGGNG